MDGRECTVAQCDSDFFTDTTNLAGGYFPVATGSHYSSGVGSSGENPTTVTAGIQGFNHSDLLPATVLCANISAVHFGRRILSREGSALGVAILPVEYANVGDSPD